MGANFIIRSVVVSMALFGLLTSTLCARQYPEARIIKPAWRPKKDEHAPVGITKINTRGREVFLNTQFAADRDWLNDLIITVNNQYSKPMILVNIHLILYDSVEGSEEPFTVYTFAAGKYEYLHTGYEGENPISVGPGDEVQVADFTKTTTNLRKFLKEKKPMWDIHRILVSVNAIFADDRIWFGEGNWGWYDINTSCKCVFPRAKSE